MCMCNVGVIVWRHKHCMKPFLTVSINPIICCFCTLNFTLEWDNMRLARVKRGRKKWAKYQSHLQECSHGVWCCARESQSEHTMWNVHCFGMERYKVCVSAGVRDVVRHGVKRKMADLVLRLNSDKRIIWLQSENICLFVYVSGCESGNKERKSVSSDYRHHNKV